MPRPPHDTMELVGGRYAAPGYVLDDGAAPYRPELAFWIVQPAGLIVATTVGEPPLSPDAVIACLTDTIELPPPPGAPCRVRVADPVLADAVAAEMSRTRKRRSSCSTSSAPLRRVTRRASPGPRRPDPPRCRHPLRDAPARRPPARRHGARRGVDTGRPAIRLRHVLVREHLATILGLGRDER